MSGQLDTMFISAHPNGVVQCPKTRSPVPGQTASSRCPATRRGRMTGTATRRWPPTSRTCGAQAVHCDLDHTIAYPAGITCQCDLAPACRRHHRCKQAPGWQLTQPEPGVMRWTTPAGRSHTTTPTVYEMLSRPFAARHMTSASAPP
jgi:hypothetical protein